MFHFKNHRKDLLTNLSYCIAAKNIKLHTESLKSTLNISLKAEMSIEREKEVYFWFSVQLTLFSDLVTFLEIFIYLIINRRRNSAVTNVKYLTNIWLNYQNWKYILKKVSLL